MDLFLPGPASLVNHHVALDNGTGKHDICHALLAGMSLVPVDSYFHKRIPPFFVFCVVIAGGLRHDGAFYRQSSPMAGATTAYHGFQLIAKRPIAKGEELFVDRTRKARFAHPAYYLTLPSAKDYEWVDDRVRAIGEGGLLEIMTEAQFQDMLYRLMHETILPGVGSDLARAKRLQALFPRTKHEFKKCFQVGSAKCHLVEKSLEWIQTNGT